MSRVAVTRVVSTPVDSVWEVFTDLTRRRTWLSEVDSVELLTPATKPLSVGTTWRETRIDRAGRAVTEELVIVAIDPGRSCTLGLANGAPSPRMTYVFTPVAVGAHRGGTVMQLIVESEPAPSRSAVRVVKTHEAMKTRWIANQLLAFTVGGFATRTAEGALRDEFDSLAEASSGGRSASRTTAA